MKKKFLVNSEKKRNKKVELKSWGRAFYENCGGWLGEKFLKNNDDLVQ